MDSSSRNCHCTNACATADRYLSTSTFRLQQKQKIKARVPPLTQNSGQSPTCAPPLPHDRFEIEITIFDVDFTQNREMSTGTQIPNPFECDNRFLISILRNFEIDFTLKSKKRSKTSIDLSRVRGLTADVPLRAYTHQVCAV